MLKRKMRLYSRTAIPNTNELVLSNPEGETLRQR